VEKKRYVSGFVTQRSPVHIHLHEKPLSSPGDQTKHFVSIPPTDRWTIRAKQSVGGAISLTLEQYAARQLGQPITNCPVRPQLVAKGDNKKLTIQAAHGKRTKNDMGGKENNSPSSRRPPSRYTTCLQQGTRMHQACATPHGRKGQDQIYALHPGDTSLARRG